jgi:alpha-D-xyloside xylohydrolase
MLGDSLLVAPVFTEEGTVDYYLPAGRWTNLLSGQVQEGPAWRHEKHGFLSLPLMVRPGTVLPLGAVDDRPDYDYADGVTFRVYELSDGVEHTCAVSTAEGAEAMRISIQRTGQQVTARLSGDASSRWQLQFAGVNTATASGGTRTSLDPLGIILQPPDGSRQIEFELS